MARTTHDRTLDHRGIDLDSNIELDGATANYADGDGLHAVISDIDDRIDAGGGSITVEKLDGTGDVTDVTVIRVASFTDNGSGDVSLYPFITTSGSPTGSLSFNSASVRIRPDSGGNVSLRSFSDGAGVFVGLNAAMWSEHTPGDLTDDGINIEVGEDYVGIQISEKDAGTIQIYPDWSSGYDVELVDRGAGEWKIRNAADTLSTPLNTLHHILTGTADPSAGGGVAHPMPAMYLRNNSNVTELWLATGTGATAWTKQNSP